METEYAIEVFDKIFMVAFNYHYPQYKKMERITNCAIIEFPGKKIYAGATIKNPHDKSDIHIARRWAFKRAVLNLWLIWTELHITSIAFQPFWQQFRQALARNEFYLKDRREN